MATQDPNKQDRLDRLLAHSSEITEFVNSFTSEEVQSKAFATVALSLGLTEEGFHGSPRVQPLHVVPPAPDAEQQEQESYADDAGSEVRGRLVRKKRTRGTAKKTFAVVRGLDFAPEDHPSLAQFDAEKRPRTLDEKFLVACYYLSEMMGIEDVEIGHLLAVFQAAEWTSPAHPDSSLRGAASRTGWLDTANTKSVKVVWKGENYLKTKMPAEPKKTG